MRRLLCWLRLGHKWVYIAGDSMKHIALAHIHPDAGLDKVCDRCGAEWFDSGHLYSDLEQFRPKPSVQGGGER
jgi:hypothetical protein